MFVLRFLVIGFLAFYSYSMAVVPGGLNSFGSMVAFSSVIFVPAFYMLPTIEAWLRESDNLPAIAAVNFFLGWSIFGWVAALVWAFKKPSVVSIPSPYREPVFTPRVNPELKPKKDCPFCGEEILLSAIKCKHCGSDLGSVST